MDDGTYTYLYGVGRVAQIAPVGAEYFLGDALGSVRQLVDDTGAIVLAQRYTPYGEILSSAGEAQTSYAFTGELYDASTGLLYLRARYYSPETGRFVTKDSMPGYLQKPSSQNLWNYVESNPVNFIDPSGKIKDTPDEIREADQIVKRLSSSFGVIIMKDWGEKLIFDPNRQEVNSCGWMEGLWNIQDLRIIDDAMNDVSNSLGNQSKFRNAFGRVSVKKIEKDVGPLKEIRPFAPPGLLSYVLGDFVMTDYAFANETYAKFTIVHELGHVWDYRNKNNLSKGLMLALETWICDASGKNCGWFPYAAHVDETTLEVVYPEPPVDTFRKCPPGSPDPSNPDRDCQQTPYSNSYGFSPLFTGPGAEDWANSFAAYIYPDYYSTSRYVGLIREGIRETYVQKQIIKIP